MYLAAATLVACTVEAPDTSVTEQHAEIHNRLAGNRLAGNRLAGNRLAGNRLAGNALSSTSFTALDETDEILNTADGREVYYYIVSCALPETITIEADIDPSLPLQDTPVDSPYTCNAATHHCSFPGNLGLTPDWLDKKLDSKGEGWISACLFSRVNRHGITKDVSLRGRNDGLAISPFEAEMFTGQEGAFFGSIFDDPDVPVDQIDWNACSGSGIATASAAERDCAVENVNGYTEGGVWFPPEPGRTICGFKYAGPCGNLDEFGTTLDQAYACDLYNPETGVYQGCHEHATKNGGGGHKYHQVITSYVTK
jgi:hypothetical protein